MKSTISKAQFYSNYYRNQPFSIPLSIIYYVSKHPKSTKSYRKLIGCCKYFFVINPILIMKTKYRKYPCALSPNANAILKKTNCKAWIDGVVSAMLITDFSFISRKLYRFDVIALFLKDQKIFLTELSFNAFNAVEIFAFLNVTILESDGSETPLEKLFEKLSKAKAISYEVTPQITSISADFVKKLTEEILPSSTICNIDIRGVPEAFDIAAFLNFWKNMDRRIIFSIDMAKEIPKSYIHKIDAIANDIFRRCYNLKFPPPLIYHPEMAEKAVMMHLALHFPLGGNFADVFERSFAVLKWKDLVRK